MQILRNFFCAVSILICCFTAVYGQKSDHIDSISAHYQNEEISGILKDIENRYSIRFFYKKECVENLRSSLDLSSVPLRIFLDSLLDPCGLTCVFYNPSLVIIAKAGELAREFPLDYFIDRRRQMDFLQSGKIFQATDHVILEDSSGSGSLKEGVITGEVTDGKNGDVLAGVIINFETIDKVLVSGPDGKFFIRLPTGIHYVSIHLTGYETKRIEINLLGNSHWHIDIFPAVIQLEEVEITGTREQSPVHSNFAGITLLTSREIKALPVFMGETDIIRSVLMIPGVSTTGEGTEGIHVRGGNIDQNLILEDGMMLFNSSHALGFFSVFNPDLVDHVTLYKGHIPAQYGGRISSVLDVNLKGPNQDKLVLNGGIGFITSKLSASIPLFHHKTTVIAGGRFTYSDWILRQAENPDIHSSAASFYDFNLKIIQQLPKGGILTAAGYRSYDHVQFAREFGFIWLNQSYAMAWSHLFMKKFLNNLNCTAGNLTNEYIKPGRIDAYKLNTGLSYYKLKDELSFTLSREHELTTGIESLLYIPSPEKKMPYGDNSGMLDTLVTRDKGLELASFINDEYTFNHLFSFSAGIRINYFMGLGPAPVYRYKAGQPFSAATITDTLNFATGRKTVSYVNAEPRFCVKYSPNEVSSIKVGYDRLSQFIHLISNTIAPIPVDLWQVSTRYIKPQAANNFSAGYFRDLAGGRWETSLDLFYRISDNILLYKDFADIPLTRHLETEIINAHGKAYGAEFYIRKRAGNPSGWMSYTFTRSLVKTGSLYPETTINEGQWFPAYYDKPHLVNFVFDLKMTRGSNLSLLYSFSSGRPVTAPTSSYFYNSYFIPYYPGRNEYRIPNYSRLDVSFTIRRNVVRNHRYTDSVTISIYNLLSRSNAFSVFFRRFENNPADAFKLSILGRAFPSATYNFKF